MVSFLPLYCGLSLIQRNSCFNCNPLVRASIPIAESLCVSCLFNLVKGSEVDVPAGCFAMYDDFSYSPLYKEVYALQTRDCTNCNPERALLSSPSPDQLCVACLVSNAKEILVMAPLHSFDPLYAPVMDSFSELYSALSLLQRPTCHKCNSKNTSIPAPESLCVTCLVSLVKGASLQPAPATPAPPIMISGSGFSLLYKEITPLQTSLCTRCSPGLTTVYSPDQFCVSCLLQIAKEISAKPVQKPTKLVPFTRSLQPFNSLFTPLAKSATLVPRIKPKK